MAISAANALTDLSPSLWKNLQSTIVNLNGQIYDHPNEALVSVFDRSYLYGDSLYEVARSYQGRFYLLDEHLKRLENSARLCRMKLNQTLDQYRDELYRTFSVFQSKYKNQDAYSRIIISRGTGKIGFGLNCIHTPTLFTIILQPVQAPTQAEFNQGMKLQVVARLRNDQRALDPAMKSGNYLNSLLAYLEANEAGFDDALLCNTEGHITEGSTFNIFYIKRGILVTPPLETGILEGITRRKVLELAQSVQIPVREVFFPKERLYEADEVFLTGSVKEVFPITQIDQVQIANRKPGPLTQQLARIYKDAIPKSKFESKSKFTSK